MISKFRKNKLLYLIGLLFLLILIGLLAYFGESGSYNNSDAKKENSELKAENSSLKLDKQGIIGSFVDNEDKAAIVFNSDGTGRYVYADSNNPDTDDSFTWKKDSANSYSIYLNDDDVTNPLKGTLSGTKLVVSGDSNWNTEIFKKAKESLNLDTFLQNAHKGTNGENHNNQKIDSAQQAAAYIANIEGVDPSIVVAKPYNNGFAVRMDDRPTRFVSKDGSTSVISGVIVDHPATDGNGHTY